MRLDIGLIGATAIAERAMVRPSAGHQECRVHAIAASDPDRAADFAARHGIPVVHKDYQSLIEDGAINVVYVSLHNAAHCMWAVRAAAAGKHVVVEKPLCLNADELAEIESAATGVHVVEAIAAAGSEWQAAIRAEIADGRYGALRETRSELRFTTLDGGLGYRGRPELGGGIFFDAASYWLQAVQATVGLDEVVGEGRSEFDGPNGVDVAFQATLTRPDSVISTVDCHFDTRHTAVHEFVFDRAVLRVRNALLPMVSALPVNLTVLAEDGRRTVRSFPAVSYYDQQFDRVSRLVAGDGEPWGAELGCAAPRIRLMAAIHTDARRRRMGETA